MKRRSSRFGSHSFGIGCCRQQLPHLLRRDAGISVEGDEPLALRVVRDGGDDADVRLREKPLDLFFDPHVRDHLAGDLAEAREPIGDADEPVRRR